MLHGQAIPRVGLAQLWVLFRDNNRTTEDWQMFWNALAVIVAIVTLLYSVRTFSKSMWLSHYADLDRMYWDLLKAGLEKPHLRHANYTRTPEQQQEYEIYAHMAWCVVESIFDRATRDKELLKIWCSAIEIENRLHREWFDREDNEYKFRQEFRRYIHTSFPVSSSLNPVKPDVIKGLS